MGLRLFAGNACSATVGAKHQAWRPRADIACFSHDGAATKAAMMCWTASSPMSSANRSTPRCSNPCPPASMNGIRPSATWSRRSRQLIANKSMRPSVVISYSSADAEPILLMVEKLISVRFFRIARARLVNADHHQTGASFLPLTTLGFSCVVGAEAPGQGKVTPLLQIWFLLLALELISDRWQRTQGSATDSRGM